MSDFDLKKIFEESKGSLSEKSENINNALQDFQQAGEASMLVCGKIFTAIHKEAGSEATKADTFLATAFILQMGATSPKTPGTKKMSIASATVTVDMVRKACREENKTTVRQFARGIKQEVIDILLAMGDAAPEGNLARTIKLELKNLTKEELMWASDFQTYNDNCPTRIRNWLVKNYRSRFRTKDSKE
jgi:hypothetical protein